MPILERVGIIAIMLLLAYPLVVVAQTASSSPLSLLYPKHQSVVGKRVNVVLDPATDWSAVPFFQVKVGSTSYPMIDTASGRHALQGVALEPGMNTITVSVLAAPTEKRSKKDEYRVVATQTVAVYSRDGGFTTVPPAFTLRAFHEPDQETLCGNCHRMEVGPEDRSHRKPEDVLCFSCHREVPTGRHIHGPAAVWDCLACHDPEQRPVRYQFGSIDPWRLERSSAPVSPAVFTISGSALFAPGSATILSEAVPSRTKIRQEEVKRLKEQERAIFQSLVEHLQQNPGDKVLIEAHVDKTSLLSKGKLRTPYLITTARARAVEKLLRTYGVGGSRRVTAKGMGISLPKGTSSSPQDRELNDRIEVVVHPPEVTVQSSQRLPSLADREQVAVTISRSTGGTPIRSVKVIESLPAGASYVRGSGVVRGAVQEPRAKGNELEWSIDRPDSPFQVRIAYMIKRAGKEASTPTGKTKVRFMESGVERSHELGTERSTAAEGTVQRVCAKCHGNMATGPITHGPVAAGYCTICHDPHGSHYSAWTRKESWSLCTTCHGEKRTDKHLIRGRGANVFHPTRRKPDPLRPGKTLACESCHSPHTSVSPELLILEARDKFDLCLLCHPKK